MIESTMVHLNSNMLVSMWIETTGNNPQFHDICEICVLLLNNFGAISQRIVPFYTSIQPFRPEAIDYKSATIPKEKIADTMLKGLPPSVAADRLEEWVNELDMPEGKKIVPIVYNWARVSGFLQNWLGFLNFRHLISPEARDIRSMALYVNDCKNHRAEYIPYAKTVPNFLGRANSITMHRSMDVMEKALRQAEIYRRMLTKS